MKTVRSAFIALSVLMLLGLAGCSAGSNVPVVSITTTTLPNGVVNQAYSQQVMGSHVDGGFFIVDGALPPGLTLKTNGTISGTPTTAGLYTFVVEADQNNSPTSPSFDITLTITIVAAT
jgi:hypothetical protein